MMKIDPLRLLLVAAMMSPLAAQPQPPVGTPPVPVPAGNPITAEKALLGKILFWDEQLSSDDRVSCGTCHTPEAGGGDLRFAAHPGLDRRLLTRDDTFGSPGLRRSTPANDYVHDPLFDFQLQVSARSAPSMIGAAYFPELFWDGRAGGEFRDPQTGVVQLAAGGALENQALGPILNPVEMAHDDRDWDQVIAKLRQVQPLALASELPADLEQALRYKPGYPGLFRQAFGTDQIDATRIAFALATYQRTLIADQSPFDDFVAQQPLALSAAQERGRQLFFGPANCIQCHSGFLFSDGSFRNLGLRPPIEDEGRGEVTGAPADDGRFKVPSLRNVALRSRFMHTGQFGSLAQVVNFYNAPPPPQPGRDPLIRPLGLNPQQRADLVAFLGALTDPRVAAASGPFTRPTLQSETQPAPGEIYGAAGAEVGGFAPRMLAETAPKLGLPDFRIGVHDGLGGSEALLGIATKEAAPGSSIGGTPLHIDLSTAYLIPMRLNGTGAGMGAATYHLHVPRSPVLTGITVVGQWFLAAPDQPNGITSSAGARWTLF